MINFIFLAIHEQSYQKTVKVHIKYIHQFSFILLKEL